MDDLKKVNKAEFLKFINEYPRKLTKDFCRIGDSPVFLYNDFEDKKGWDAVVARHQPEVKDWSEEKFFILKEVNGK